KKNVDVGRRFDELPGVRRVARDTRRQAVGFGIVFGKMGRHFLLSPGVHRYGFAGFQSERDVFNQEDVGGSPEASEIDASAGKPGRRFRRSGGLGGSRLRASQSRRER